ncbi:MAG: hypothetical protein C4297_08785 [Gemmataceae bacterium]
MIATLGLPGGVAREPQQPGAGYAQQFGSVPGAPGYETYSQRERARSELMAPAIFLIIIAGLGLAINIYDVVMSFQPPPAPDPNLPDWLKQWQQHAHGPLGFVFGLVGIAVCSLILSGAIAMLSLKYWGLAMTACILAIVNFRNCCCLLGIPVGSWGLVVLTRPHVKDAFYRERMPEV